jgi:hypothetical protein
MRRSLTPPGAFSGRSRSGQHPGSK